MHVSLDRRSNLVHVLAIRLLGFVPFFGLISRLSTIVSAMSPQRSVLDAHVKFLWVSVYCILVRWSARLLMCMGSTVFTRKARLRGLLFAVRPNQSLQLDMSSRQKRVLMSSEKKPAPSPDSPTGGLDGTVVLYGGDSLQDATWLSLAIPAKNTSCEVSRTAHVLSVRGGSVRFVEEQSAHQTEESTCSRTTSARQEDAVGDTTSLWQPVLLQDKFSFHLRHSSGYWLGVDKETREMCLMASQPSTEQALTFLFPKKRPKTLPFLA